MRSQSFDVNKKPVGPVHRRLYAGQVNSYLGLGREFRALIRQEAPTCRVSGNLGFLGPLVEVFPQVGDFLDFLGIFMAPP